MERYTILARLNGEDSPYVVGVYSPEHKAADELRSLAERPDVAGWEFEVVPIYDRREFVDDILHYGEDPPAAPAPAVARCLLEAGHEGGHVFPTRKPIGDRMADGEWSDPEGIRPPRPLAVPGVTVPANRPRCDAEDDRPPTSYAICFDWPEMNGEPWFAARTLGHGSGFTGDIGLAIRFESEDQARRLLDAYPEEGRKFGTVVEVSEPVSR